MSRAGFPEQIVSKCCFLLINAANAVSGLSSHTREVPAEKKALPSPRPSHREQGLSPGSSPGFLNHFRGPGIHTSEMHFKEQKVKVEVSERFSLSKEGQRT